MPDVLILNAEEVAELLQPDKLEEALTVAMGQVSAKATDVPPRIGASSPDGVLLAKPGYVAGLGLAAKLVSVFPGNDAKGLPSHNGVVVLFDETTGVPIAIMDAEYLTEMRTSVMAAMAADALARPDSKVLTIVGAGAQARGHAVAFAKIRNWSEVRVFNRSQHKAVIVAAAAAEAADCEGVVAETLAEALDGADVVALCTHSTEALFEASAVAPGTHVSSVSSQHEMDPALAQAAEPLVVEWKEAITTPVPAGASELQGIDPDTAVEIGELLANPQLGRQSVDAITVYKSTGHAAQDVAAARVVYAAAVEQGVGTTIQI